MAAYSVTWSSDIKSNVTNELPDPKNLKISSMRFYFDKLVLMLVSGTVNVFKMAAISGHMTTQQQI